MIDIEKILGALRSISLSVHERSRLRSRVELHVRENPVRASYESRITQAFREMVASFENALNSRVFITHPAFAACVLVLCIGVGTSYAAQGSLPGQALYAFKTRVNEPLQGALAVSPESKAIWSSELAGRRLQEAEELAATNQLSPVAAADIENGLDAAVENFNSSIARISKNDDAKAASAQSDLEASLNAHEVVLSSLPTKEKRTITQITSVVHKHAETISAERSLSESALTSTDSPEVKVAALTRQKSAEEEVNETQALSARAGTMQVASSVAMIAAEARNDIKAGQNDATKGHWGKAFGAFQDAIRKMKETRNSVEAQNRLKVLFGIRLDSSAATSTATTSATISTSTKDAGNSND